MTWTVVLEPRALDGLRRLRLLDPVGAKTCTAAIRALADEPRPEGAFPLGESGYYRLAVGTWRVLYQVDEDALFVLNIGRAS
ncbi:type II toxin-antitoxin system RelE/ParE family toxin [Streptomyces mobaraensis]|uniref:type II toxin-antitoxin system RelE family toxin n=1 Tax=Streptomyces mobaraensis TaxID=35621 RepID=UPI003322E6C1